MNAADRRAVEQDLGQLISRFSYCIDNGRYEELAGLFTEDCLFDRVGDRLEGRGAILAAMRKRHSYLTRHVITNILFTRVEADEAEATMYVVNFVGESPTAGLPVGYAMEPAVLEFTDQYRRTDDGWLIAQRMAKVIIKPAKAGH